MKKQSLSKVSRVVRNLKTKKQILLENQNNKIFKKLLRIIKLKIVDYFLEKTIDYIILLFKIDSNPFEFFQNIDVSLNYLILLIIIKPILLWLIDFTKSFIE